MQTGTDSNSSEQAILEQHRAGHFSEATVLLLDAYGQQIFRFIGARLSDRALAEDAFADFLHDLWRGLAGFRWECSARVWAYALARHAVIRCSKKARQRQQREVPASKAVHLSQIEQRIRTQTRTELRTASRQRVAKLCRQLPERDQTLLALRVSRQLDWKEIAQVMNQVDSRVPGFTERESARLRKRFQAIKTRLRALATHDGVSGVTSVCLDTPNR